MTDGNRTNPLLLILAVIGVIAVLGWLGMSLMHGSAMGSGMMGGTMGGSMMGGGWLIGLLVVVAIVARAFGLAGAGELPRPPVYRRGRGDPGRRGRVVVSPRLAPLGLPAANADDSGVGDRPGASRSDVPVDRSHFLAGARIAAR